MRHLAFAALLAACSGPAAAPPEDPTPPRETAKPSPPLAVVVVLAAHVSDDTAADIRAGMHAVVDDLPDDALFGAVTVSWKPWIDVEFQRVSHRGAIDGAIDGMDRGGGSEWAEGLELAYDMLAAVDAAREVVVFVAEGRAEYFTDTIEAAERLQKDGVELNVVALPNVDSLVDEMARAGGGRILAAADLAQLAEVMPAAVSGTAAAPPPAPP